MEGFGESYYGYSQNFGNGPGVFRNTAWVKVTEEGTNITELISTCFLSPYDQKQYNQRIKQRRTDGKGLSRSIKIRDLPETKVIDQDVVRCIDPLNHRLFGKELFVLGVEFNSPATTNDDGIAYRVSEQRNGSSYTYLPNEAIELVRRGNLWKYYFGGDQDKPVFDCLREEAAFAKMIGKCKQIRNTKGSGNYSWEKDEVLNAIEEGEVDAIEVNSMFGSNPMTSAWKFEDRDLGNRVANETLYGFDRPRRKG